MGIVEGGDMDTALHCDGCGAEITADELFWIDREGDTVCEKCLLDNVLTYEEIQH